MNQSPTGTFRMTAVTLIMLSGSILLMVSCDSRVEEIQPLEMGYDVEPLHAIAKNDPDRRVEIEVKFRSSQQLSNISELIAGSDLQLISLRWENSEGAGGVYSLGPPCDDQSKDIGTVLSEIERFYWANYSTWSGDPETPGAAGCRSEYESSPVAGTGQDAAEPRVETACRMQIIGLGLSGSAADAFALGTAAFDVATISRIPSKDELFRAIKARLKSGR